MSSVVVDSVPLIGVPSVDELYKAIEMLRNAGISLKAATTASDAPSVDVRRGISISDLKRVSIPFGGESKTQSNIDECMSKIQQISEQLKLEPSEKFLFFQFSWSGV